MRVSIALLAVVVGLLVVLGVTSPRRAAAGVIQPLNCDAKLGTQTDDGEHPILWPVTDLLSVALGAPAADGSRSISINAIAPVIAVTGSVDSEGKVTASGSGTYSSFQTSVTFDGEIEFYDENNTILKLLSGLYTVGGQGELPGGKTITFKSYCPFQPPQSVADADGDGKPGVFFYAAPVGINVSGGLTAYSHRGFIEYLDKQGHKNNVTLTPADIAQFLFTGSMGGPLESIVERRYREIKVKFGASINPLTASLGITMPDSLGGGTQDIQTSGYFNGFGALNGLGTVLNDLGFKINIVGNSFDFVHGTASTGLWRIYNDRSIKPVATLNPATGKITVHLRLLFDAPNLRMIAAAAAGVDTTAADVLTGVPLPFDVTIANLVSVPIALASLLDNCPNVANPGQADANHDGLGDACEGFYWGDPTCDGFAGASDALDTLRKIAGTAALTPDSVGCPDFGASVAGHTFGDWNCDGTMNPLDALILLEKRAGAPRPTPAPGCPDLGVFVSMVG